MTDWTYCDRAGVVALSTEVRTFAVTVPAGTPIDAPATFNTSFPARNVEQVELAFPPGPMGAVGVAIGAAGQPVLPYNAGAWIVADNDVITYPVVGAHDSGSWEVFAYNLGNFPHTIQVRFLLTTIGAPGDAAPLQLVSSAALSNTPIGG